MPNLFQKTSAALKAMASAFRYGGPAPSGMFAPRSGGGTGSLPFFGDNRNRGLAAKIGMNPEEINYAAKVGDITATNAVWTCLMWLMRNYPSAPVRVRDKKTKEVVPDHPLEQLLANPTIDAPISWSTLSAGFNLSYWGDGNGYLFKIRNAYGEVVELWWRPHWMVEPKRQKGVTLPGGYTTTGEEFISFYEYKPGPNAQTKQIAPKDVVHLRFGFDPQNEMKGASPLRALLRTTFTELEANQFLASVLVNLGVVGAVFTHKPSLQKDPETGISEWYTLPDEEVATIKRTFQENFTGGRRGGAMVLDGEFETVFPNGGIDSGLAERAKKISQADIAAAFGIPPAVLGFLVGLEYQDARAAHASMLRQAYDSCLCPMQRDNAEDFNRQLLTEFVPQTRLLNGRYKPLEVEVFFDYNGVPAMQESQDGLWKRAGQAFKDGGLTRNEYRQIIGKDPVDGEDEFFTAPSPAPSDPPDPNDDPPPGKKPGKTPPRSKGNA